MLIFLCGFMGCGKTTFLKKLEKTSKGKEQFIDLDREMECRFALGQNLGAYIEKVGWEKFREQEKKLIEEYLVQEHSLGVVALGGGALNSEIIHLMKSKSGFLVWINTPFEKCWERIKNDQNRPLVQKGREELFKIYQERVAFYAQAQFQLHEEELLKISNLDELRRVLARD